MFLNVPRTGQKVRLSVVTPPVVAPCCPGVQVRYNEASGAVLSAAAKLGGGRAQPALQLVGYEGEVEAAVKYAFGSAFVCQVRRATT